MSRRILSYLLPGAALAVLLGGGALAAVETDTVGSFGDGVWWAISLVTTVGFVDHAPHTTPGRVVASLLMVLGFGLLSLTTAAIASIFVRQDDAPSQARDIAFEAEVLKRLQDMSGRLERLEHEAGERAVHQRAG